MNKSELKPAVVFEQFAKINEIPRPSKREEKMIEYLTNWGKSHSLDTATSLSAREPLQAMKTARRSYCKATWTWFAINLSM